MAAIDSIRTILNENLGTPPRRGRPTAAYCVTGLRYHGRYEYGWYG